MISAKSILRVGTPPYLLQPLQVLKRLRLEYFWRSKREAFVTLPWGLPIKINPHESIGFEIASQGLYEIGVTETLWRLTEPGDLAVDAGANIGYMSSILGIRVGPKGKVFCFEPHPEVFASLQENLEMWKKDRRCGTFIPIQAALGKANGKTLLHVSNWFRTNRGTAWISDKLQAAPDVKVIEVPIQNLDSLLNAGETIGVLKMDVEKQELGVLEGMTRLLEQHAVRDIIFEEWSAFPAPTHKFLKSKGYSIFGLQEHFAGIRCLPDAQPAGETPNYLATMDPKRANALIAPAMWRSFGPARLFANNK